MATREQLIEDFANHKLATGEKFVNLINSMKAVQEPVSDPAASGTSLSFIDSISQDADGKITATKKTLDLSNAHELNPFKGWYETGDTLPTDGFDGAYLYFKDTSEQTGLTTIYRWNGTTYADTGTVVDTSNVQSFASGQAVNAVHIKDLDGNDVSGDADVLSEAAGKTIGDAIFGGTSGVIAVIQPHSVTNSAFIAKYDDEGEGNVQITKSSNNQLHVAFYPITQGRKYTVDIPLTSNQYTGVYAYTTNTTPETITETTNLTGKHFANVGDNDSQQIVIDSALDYAYLAVCYSDSDDTNVPTVTEEYEQHTAGLQEKVETVETLHENVESLEETVETLQGNIETLQGDVETLQENVETLDQTVNGNTETRYEEQSLDTGYYYNTHNNGDVINLTKISNINISCVKIDVNPGDVFRITGKGGNQYSYLYATCESEENNTVIRHATNGQDTRNNTLELTIQSGEGILVVNFTGVSSTDKVEKISEVTVGGVLSKIGNLDNLETTSKDNLVNAINEINSEIELLGGVEVILPDKIYAVVGDTLQLFYRAMVKAKNIYNYDIRVSCLKGAQYKRYFQYTPTTDDIGTTEFDVSVRNNNGEELAHKSCQIVTVDVVGSPQQEVNILVFGDSLTYNLINGAQYLGAWSAETYRRLCGTGGSPAGKGLTNIKFVGAFNAAQEPNVGYFGSGGWQWGNYISKGSRAFRFFVTGVMAINYRSTYTNNGITFTVQEVNVDENTHEGNILCTMSGTTGEPEESGYLIRTSTGSSDQSVEFTRAVLDSQNPLWDIENDVFTFVPYVEQYCGDITGEQLAVYVLLGGNGLKPYQTNFENLKSQIRTFADKLHSEYPNAKLKIISSILPNQYDMHGQGASGKFNEYSYSDSYASSLSVLNEIKAYQELANEPAYSTFVEYVGLPCQFDSESNMMTVEKDVNTRNTAKELVGNNGFHPELCGQYQVADAVYRNIVANYCQGV